MKVEESGSLLMIYLEGRIDSVSAPRFGKGDRGHNRCT